MTATVRVENHLLTLHYIFLNQGLFEFIQPTILYLVDNNQIFGSIAPSLTQIFQNTFTFLPPVLVSYINTTPFRT
jgi:hypothetical protein